MTSTDKLSILLTSDLHFIDTGFRYKSPNYMNTIIKTLQTNKINANIVPGDLTDFDEDGSHCCCIYYGGKTDQMKPMIDTYIKPVEKYTKIYECMGNHDNADVEPFKYKPMANFIRKRHKSLHYSFDLSPDDKIDAFPHDKNFIHFVSLSTYPTDKALEFLQDDMKGKEKSPTIIFFHYNLVGPWSDWWSDTQKEKFYSVIKDYNIIALFVGHWHNTYSNTWNNIPVISGAGDNSFYIVDIDTKTFKINLRLIIAD